MTLELFSLKLVTSHYHMIMIVLGSLGKLLSCYDLNLLGHDGEDEKTVETFLLFVSVACVVLCRVVYSGVKKFS